MGKTSRIGKKRVFHLIKTEVLQGHYEIFLSKNLLFYQIR